MFKYYVYDKSPLPMTEQPGYSKGLFYIKKQYSLMKKKQTLKNNLKKNLLINLKKKKINF